MAERGRVNEREPTHKCVCPLVRINKRVWVCMNGMNAMCISLSASSSPSAFLLLVSTCVVVLWHFYLARNNSNNNNTQQQRSSITVHSLIWACCCRCCAAAAIFMVKVAVAVAVLYRNVYENVLPRRFVLCGSSKRADCRFLCAPPPRPNSRSVT